MTYLVQNMFANNSYQKNIQFGISYNILKLYIPYHKNIKHNNRN